MHARLLRFGRIRGSISLPIVCLLWGAVVMAAMSSLFIYKQTPGPQPAQVAPKGSEAKPELVLFLHPMCPCSKATVAELSRLTATAGHKLAVKVFFAMPRVGSEEWLQAPLISQARQIPGVSVAFDTDGAEAKRLGVKTSGQAILFDTSGKPVFQGGITASRGHEGDNAGSDSILAYLRTGKAPLEKTPVFGCQLGEFGGGN